MKAIFADSQYWIALLNPKDPYYCSAKRNSEKYFNRNTITSEMVLVEVLTFLGKFGYKKREKVYKFVAALQKRPDVRIIPQTTELFRRSLEFYAKRLDKKYSLVDCSSMVLMKEQGLNEIYSNDHHFEQEKFTLLLSRES